MKPVMMFLFSIACLMILGCATNSSYYVASVAENTENYSFSGQEKNSANTDSWKIHLNDGTVFSFVTLDSIKSRYLFIGNKGEITKISIHDIDKIESTKESKFDGTEILGVLGGALVGGAIGLLVAPKTTLFGSTFIPDGEYYIAAGAVIGGTLGYFAIKGNTKDIYEFDDLIFAEKIFILKSIIAE